MNDVFRIVTRIQDQDDFSGSLTDGAFLQYISATDKFELQSISSTSPGGDSGQLQYNSSGTFSGIDHSSIGIAGDIFTISSLATDDIPLVLKGFSGQTDNLTEWRDDSDAVMASISPSGRIFGKSLKVLETVAANSGEGFVLSSAAGIGVGSNMSIWFSDSIAAGGTADINFIRSGTSQLNIQADAGVIISNLANSAYASLTCNAITASGVVKSSGSWSSGGVPAQFGKGTSDADAFIGDRYYFGNGSGFAVGSDNFIGWSDSLDQNGVSTDYNLKLYRDAANILALRNELNAQSLRIYSTFTSLTVHECLQFYAVSGANFEIATKNGSVGGSRRGLTIGGYYESDTTITPWLTFTNAGVATFEEIVNVPTAAPGTDTTQAASTAFVTEAVASGGGGGITAARVLSYSIIMGS